MTTKAESCILEDDERIDRLVDKYPYRIPVDALSSFLHIDAQSLRAYLESGINAFGMAWKKIGKDNHAYAIPTAQFLRWYKIMR